MSQVKANSNPQNIPIDAPDMLIVTYLEHKHSDSYIFINGAILNQMLLVHIYNKNQPGVSHL